MLKVLFVSSGNSENGISPIVKKQGESLINSGVDVGYFSIIGKGLKGYLKNVIPLKKHIRQHPYDLIHAHYSFSAFTATLAGCKPLVVSLMGSDSRPDFISKAAIRVSSFFSGTILFLNQKTCAKTLGSRTMRLFRMGLIR